VFETLNLIDRIERDKLFFDFDSRTDLGNLIDRIERTSGRARALGTGWVK